jgi:hypothetical protein
MTSSADPSHAPPQPTTVTLTQPAAPTTDDDHAVGPNEAARRRWIDSFGTALLPFVLISVCRYIYSGVSLDLVNTVDLCFAMLSAATVLILQVVDKSRSKPFGDIWPTLFVVIAFFGLFIVVAISASVAETASRKDLSTTASSSIVVLRGADNFITQSNPRQSPGDIAQVHAELEQAAKDVETKVALAGGSAPVTRSTWLTVIFSFLFLVCSILIWRAP